LRAKPSPAMDTLGLTEPIYRGGEPPNRAGSFRRAKPWMAKNISHWQLEE
jgi:hypothetical protein